MTTENLREFILLASIGTYTGAAEALYISETTLSRHIMALEKELGASLFRRLPRRLELTESGTVFLSYAQQIVSEEDACLQAISHKLNFSRSTLSIGFDSALAYYSVARMICSFAEKYPEFLLRLTDGSTFSLRDQVANGQLQLAFVLDDREYRSNSLRYRQYRRDELVAVLPISHPLANQKSIHLSALSRERLLLPPPFTAMYELCVKALRSAGLEPEAQATADFSGRVVPELVRNGFCAAIVPLQIAEGWQDRGVAVCSVLPKTKIGTALVYDPDTLSRAGRLFMEYAFGGNWA